MQVTTPPEEIIEIYPYQFNVAEVEAGRRLFVGTIRLDGHDMTEDDVRKKNAVLADIGKWEALMDAVTGFLSEFGMRTPLSTGVSEYSDKRYHTDSSSSQGVYIGLEAEERRRREVHRLAGITVQEVASQLRNVPRWRQLVTASNLIRNDQRNREAEIDRGSH
jgi:hypothetical protein